MSTILQIIPCTSDLYAKYKEDNGEFSTKIICLALVQDGKYRSIVGVDACDCEISLVESSTNFVGYSDSPLPERTP